MSRPTIQELRQQLAIQNTVLPPMNPSPSAYPNPQVAAVHQTLAGERLTYQIQFPATGDPDCDLIQGILAVSKATNANPHLAVRVLHYLLERFGRELDNEKQPAQEIDWHSAIQQAVDRAVHEQQHRFQGPQPYTTSAGLGSVSQPHSPQFLSAVDQMLAKTNLHP